MVHEGRIGSDFGEVEPGTKAAQRILETHWLVHA